MCIIISLQEGRSPLHVAVEKGQKDIVDILLKHGASTDLWDMVRNL